MERPSSSAQNKFREAVKMNVVEPPGGQSPEIGQGDIVRVCKGPGSSCGYAES